MRNAPFVPKRHSGISLRGSYIIVCVNDGLAAGPGDEGGARHHRNCSFLGDIEPQTVGIGFVADVGLASRRPDLLVDSPRLNLHESARFHGDTNLKTTDDSPAAPRLGFVSFLSKLELQSHVRSSEQQAGPL